MISDCVSRITPLSSDAPLISVTATGTEAKLCARRVAVTTTSSREVGEAGAGCARISPVPPSTSNNRHQRFSMPDMLSPPLGVWTASNGGTLPLYCRQCQP